MKANLYRVFTELSDADTKGVAISSPGAVDTEEGVIKGFSAIPYIHHLKIIDELEAMFGLPVTIENDANCAGLAESQFGIGKDSKNQFTSFLGQVLVVRFALMVNCTKEVAFTVVNLVS